MNHWQSEQRHIAAGQLLLLVTVCVVAVALPFLHPELTDWTAVAGIGTAIFTVLLLTLRIRWAQLPTAAALLFPAVAMAGLAAVGLATRPEISSCFGGLFVLWFGYVGAFQPRHSELALLPLAVPAYLASAGSWGTVTMVGLVIAAAIWVTLAEVFAFLTKQQRVAVRHWERAALVDDLTQVGNRRSIDRRLVQTCDADVIVMCDLDHFKALNDVAGHAAGDEVLRDFGATVRGCLRGDDFVGRYGGEEFLLVLAETRLGEVEDVLRRVRRRFHRVHPEVTFSAGYALHERTRTPRQTVIAADAALYAAKDQGRDRFVAELSQARISA